MREIKFRAWDKMRGKMIEIVGLHWDNEQKQWKAYDNEGIGGYLNSDYLSGLLQYTGMKDTNGVKIHEGDVVKLSDNIIHDGELVECVWAMFHGGFLFRFITGPNMGKWTDMADTWRSYEVVGNKFDNPELLEGNE